MIDEIKVLDELTIDEIAAGEVVERPLNVVKELVENSIDAGASAITVEIKEGGISLIRVTDNGRGIEKSQIKRAFLRHATSKIRTAKDLQEVYSLGFRGEALSSISAVANIELITKTTDEMLGSRCIMEAGVLQSFEDIGAPNGSTFLVKNLFFNVPARKKFLKKNSTEGSYIIELMEHLALSHPDISFKVIQNGKEKFHTYGNHKLDEVIYQIFGKEIVKDIIPISFQNDTLTIHGFIGKPSISRGNRNFQNFFINHRYIHSILISKAIEEGYDNRLMKHQFPFAILHISMPLSDVDVNVHPTKLEVRFHKEQEFYSTIVDCVRTLLKNTFQIPQVSLSEDTTPKSKPQDVVVRYPEPFEQNRKELLLVEEDGLERTFHTKSSFVQDTMQRNESNIMKEASNEGFNADFAVSKSNDLQQEVEQMCLFSDSNETKSPLGNYYILGQVFDTYWLIKNEENLYLLDQHAAHEKIKYEGILKRLKNKTICSQAILPPIILSFRTKEEALLTQYWDIFISLGFEIEQFGGKEYALRGIPVDLYGCDEKQLLYAILDELGEIQKTKLFTAIEEKIASMSCKAAIKGSSIISMKEASVLIEELLALDNPFQCPHGRPTIVAMSKYELEKKFKRIL